MLVAILHPSSFVCRKQCRTRPSSCPTSELSSCERLCVKCSQYTDDGCGAATAVHALEFAREQDDRTTLESSSGSVVV